MGWKLYTVVYSIDSTIIEETKNIKEILDEYAEELVDRIPFPEEGQGEEGQVPVSDGKGGTKWINMPSFSVGASNEIRKNINKYFILTVDDVEAPFLTIADRLASIGFYPALALKMEPINNGAITWDDLRTLQNMGFEICFHGMLHSHTPYGTAPNNDEVMIADIAEYKALCKENGINLYGYCGPNHYPLPAGAFKEFEWARSAYGVDSYGWDSYRLSDSFASIQAGVAADWATASTEETLNTIIGHADNLADNQYLTPMCHSQNIVANIDSYMQLFQGWINKGLVPLKPMEAVRQSLFNAGGLGQNSTFEIQAGTATTPYWVVAGNGIVRTNQGTE